MKWQKINNVLHRDLGYIFFFLIIIYSVSGIAINHASDWNPDFYVDKKYISELDLPDKIQDIDENMIKNQLEIIGESDNYLLVDYPSKSKFKVYYKNGSLLYDLQNKKGELERIQRRPLFYEMNLLHRNPGNLWTWIADIFAVGLIIIATTGIMVLKGKNGIKGRGKWLILSSTLSTVLIIFLVI